MAEANLTLSAAILYSGNTFGRIREMMQIAKISFLGQTLYYKIQKQILCLFVNQVYNNNHTKIVLRLKSNKVELLEVGRFDSSGYSAKYCTYTVMDKETKSVSDFSVVHVGTLPNSYHMEKQGLIDCLESIEKNGLVVKALTMDSHVQIKSYEKMLL